MNAAYGAFMYPYNSNANAVASGNTIPGIPTNLPPPAPPRMLTAVSGLVAVTTTAQGLQIIVPYPIALDAMGQPQASGVKLHRFDSPVVKMIQVWLALHFHRKW